MVSIEVNFISRQKSTVITFYMVCGVVSKCFFFEHVQVHMYVEYGFIRAMIENVSIKPQVPNIMQKLFTYHERKNIF